MHTQQAVTYAGVLIAGEGLHGERGVRRSSRDKHAPLEYWRNERKVYNREFRSKCQGLFLATSLCTLRAVVHAV